LGPPSSPTTARATIFALLLLGLAACSPSRGIEAARVLADLVADDGDSSLKQARPAPERLVISAPSGRLVGDLHWPGEPALAALVLVPGAAPLGKDDPKLVAFATTLARARFAVLVPEIASLRALQVSPADADPIADAIGGLAICSGGQVGLAAISYAAGPAILAALRPATREQVGFVLAIGGYHDLEAVVTFFTTGFYREGPDHPWQHREPNAYGKWVFVRANAERLDDARDHALLAAMASRKLADLDAPIDDLRQGLGPEGQTVIALLDNRDPKRAGALIAALPETVGDDLHALDLKHRDLGELQARAILVHGRDDPIIPASESQALAAALPEAEIYVVDSLAHVELNPTGVVDGLRLWHAIAQVLAERDALPVPDRERCMASLAGD
jgi:pimeloyl-ACP methyl ester carboxylesterase